MVAFAVTAWNAWIMQISLKHQIIFLCFLPCEVHVFRTRIDAICLMMLEGVERLLFWPPAVLLPYNW